MQIPGRDTRVSGILLAHRLLLAELLARLDPKETSEILEKLEDFPNSRDLDKFVGTDPSQTWRFQQAYQQEIRLLQEPASRL